MFAQLVDPMSCDITNFVFVKSEMGPVMIPPSAVLRLWTSSPSLRPIAIESIQVIVVLQGRFEVSTHQELGGLSLG